MSSYNLSGRHKLSAMDDFEGFDPRFKHPFNMVVVGPTRSGKTTFVNDLVVNNPKSVTCDFDYINLFLGTPREVNTLAKNLVNKYGSETVRVVEDLMRKQFNNDCDALKKQFPIMFQDMIVEGKKGLVIFDDLMGEMSNCDVLAPLFTKWSSHMNISTIHITQDISYSSSGSKHQSSAATAYRNTKYMLLFPNPMDVSVFRFIASRLDLGIPSTKETIKFLQRAAESSPPVLIDGDLHTPNVLRVRTDLFAKTEEGIPFQVVHHPRQVIC